MGLTPTPVAERPSLTRDDIEVLTLLAEGLPLFHPGGGLGRPARIGVTSVEVAAVDLGASSGRVMMGRVGPQT
ncbi:MAG TPA: hypothetical protein VFU19_17270, partial [Iamia sp.]|nr:hypothetical protein [Iamia sp.]